MIMFRMTHEAILRKVQQAHIAEMDEFEVLYNQACEKRDTAIHLLQAALVLLGTVDTKRSGGAALRERIAMLKQEVEAHGWLEEAHEEDTIECHVADNAQQRIAGMQEREETA